MITISACLIVKNEEAVLARCLNSLQGIVDEIIIVDTGSTDQTMEIAANYTSKLYEFSWTGDFSEARNFSFSKATMEYIYTADADEVIDEKNRNRFLQLKRALLPEIEIVQMYYTNQLKYNTTYNFDREYRPKLYRRLRTFQWEEPVHEAVRLSPVIFDSEIEIQHCPQSDHSERDFSVFQSAIHKNGGLSGRLRGLYARELLIAGNTQNFLEAESYFKKVLAEQDLTEEELRQCQCVLVRCARLQGEVEEFFKHCLKNIALDSPSSEVCFELGEFYFEQRDYTEATVWYYNAAYETKPELVVKYGTERPLLRLAECYLALGEREEAEKYQQLAKEAGELKNVLVEENQQNT